MIEQRSRFFALACALLACDALSSCNNSFFLRGTLGGDCDPPRTVTPVTGGSDAATLRMSNCQVMDSTCCRRSAVAGRTSCQYPEDCYRAPFGGAAPPRSTAPTRKPARTAAASARSAVRPARTR